MESFYIYFKFSKLITTTNYKIIKNISQIKFFIKNENIKFPPKTIRILMQCSSSAPSGLHGYTGV